ncbi:hypothetical protein CCUS01_14855 [Colletotrichum cuscutae]|uniref:Uncharacterized protein n=1 Tax=Colletotrichum cuscutae TaxID=1209917 RepID=A0AAI9Y5E3_9PEZI|nr:hypothetical protein CCUS01_14855 [Colletotrichum cuscutae]
MFLVNNESAYIFAIFQSSLKCFRVSRSISIDNYWPCNDAARPQCGSPQVIMTIMTSNMRHAWPTFHPSRGSKSSKIRRLILILPSFLYNAINNQILHSPCPELAEDEFSRSESKGHLFLLKNSGELGRATDSNGRGILYSIHPNLKVHVPGDTGKSMVTISRKLSHIPSRHLNYRHGLLDDISRGIQHPALPPLKPVGAQQLGTHGAAFSLSEYYGEYRLKKYSRFDVNPHDTYTTYIGRMLLICPRVLWAHQHFSTSFASANTISRPSSSSADPDLFSLDLTRSSSLQLTRRLASPLRLNHSFPPPCPAFAIVPLPATHLAVLGMMNILDTCLLPHVYCALLILHPSEIVPAVRDENDRTKSGPSRYDETTSHYGNPPRWAGPAGTPYAIHFGNHSQDCSATPLPSRFSFGNRQRCDAWLRAFQPSKDSSLAGRRKSSRRQQHGRDLDSIMRQTLKEPAFVMKRSLKRALGGPVNVMISRERLVIDLSLDANFNSYRRPVELSTFRLNDSYGSRRVLPHSRSHVLRDEREDVAQWEVALTKSPLRIFPRKADRDQMSSDRCGLLVLFGGPAQQTLISIWLGNIIRKLRIECQIAEEDSENEMLVNKAENGMERSWHQSKTIEDNNSKIMLNSAHLISYPALCAAKPSSSMIKNKRKMSLILDDERQRYSDIADLREQPYDAHAMTVTFTHLLDLDICVKGSGEDKLAIASAHQEEHRVSRLNCVENHRVVSVLTILIPLEPVYLPYLTLHPSTYLFGSEYTLIIGNPSRSKKTGGFGGTWMSSGSTFLDSTSFDGTFPEETNSPQAASRGHTAGGNGFEFIIRGDFAGCVASVSSRRYPVIIYTYCIDTVQLYDTETAAPAAQLNNPTTARTGSLPRLSRRDYSSDDLLCRRNCSQYHHCRFVSRNVLIEDRLCRLIQLCPFASRMDYSDVPACRRRGGPHEICDDELAPSGAGQEAAFVLNRHARTRDSDKLPEVGSSNRTANSLPSEVGSYYGNCEPGYDDSNKEKPAQDCDKPGLNSPLSLNSSRKPSFFCEEAKKRHLQQGKTGDVSYPRFGACSRCGWEEGSGIAQRRVSGEEENDSRTKWLIARQIPRETKESQESGGTAGQLARNEMIRLAPSEIWALPTRSLEEWERQGKKNETLLRLAFHEDGIGLPYNASLDKFPTWRLIEDCEEHRIFSVVGGQLVVLSQAVNLDGEEQRRLSPIGT